MPVYIVVKGSVFHDGDYYHHGTEIELEAKAAEPLIEAGVIAKHQADAKPKARVKPKVEEGE